MEKKIIEKIQELVKAGVVKNGVGTKVLARVLEMPEADVFTACEAAVGSGKLARGRGKGGSYRLPGRFVMSQWGGRTGHAVPGSIAAKHKAEGFRSKALGQKRPRKTTVETVVDAPASTLENL